MAETIVNARRHGMWTFGGVLYLSGLLLVLGVFGLLADHEYNIAASSGAALVDSPVVVRLQPTPVPRPRRTTTAQSSNASIASSAPAVPTVVPSFVVPNLNTDPEPVPVGETVASEWQSTITRIVVPVIKLDKQVVPVHWTTQQQDGQDVAVFDVDLYRVGHHQGTSNPGDGSNIVLAGHSGGRAYPFNDIYYLKPGDLIELTSNGQLYDYVVSDHIVVDEVGQPMMKRRENAQYILPTDEEIITMVACWPLTGKDKFKQRVIIRATPLQVPETMLDLSSIRAR